ncbi:MAG: hypothetical protein ACRDPE_11375 [Solirubrobacterales bacterium]
MIWLIALTNQFVRLVLINGMGRGNDKRASVTLVTLGPTGTCHERAAIEYMAFQGVEDFEMEFIGDFFDGLERIRGKDNAFLIQCSAHPKVHEVTERYWAEVFVVDTFIYPTKALAVLSRREVEQPRTLGLVPATSGYVDRSDWAEIIDVQSKPIVAEELLAGRYDAGLTHLEHLAAHPDELRLIEGIGEIDTTWVVYRARKRYKGSVIGIPSPDLFHTPVIEQGRTLDS